MSADLPTTQATSIAMQDESDAKDLKDLKKRKEEVKIATDEAMAISDELRRWHALGLLGGHRSKLRLDSLQLPDGYLAKKDDLRRRLQLYVDRSRSGRGDEAAEDGAGSRAWSSRAEVEGVEDAGDVESAAARPPDWQGRSKAGRRYGRSSSANGSGGSDSDCSSDSSSSSWWGEGARATAGRYPDLRQISPRSGRDLMRAMEISGPDGMLGGSRIRSDSSDLDDIMTPDLDLDPDDDDVSVSSASTAQSGSMMRWFSGKEHADLAQHARNTADQLADLCPEILDVISSSRWEWCVPFPTQKKKYFWGGGRRGVVYLGMSASECACM